MPHSRKPAPHSRRALHLLGATALALLGVAGKAAHSQPVDYYVVSYGICDEPHLAHPTVILRSFQQAATEYYLVVDVVDLTTRIIPQRSARRIDTTLTALSAAFSGLPYFQALQNARKNCCPQNDAGLLQKLSRAGGTSLTADLCASHRPLDRDFFSGLLATLGPTHKPLAIAIAASGLWLAEHGEDVRWLNDLHKKNELAITWINHSHSHRLARDLPVAENFLLEKGTKLDYEVLQSEITMINHGITPSVFFRFPGRVSDTTLFGSISNLGLIPVGSDGWLAENQWPAHNGIVLLSAGACAPIEAGQFLSFIKQKPDSLLGRSWLLYDLGQSGMSPTRNAAGSPARR
jgi:hypothetical protein